MEKKVLEVGKFLLSSLSASETETWSIYSVSVFLSSTAMYTRVRSVSYFNESDYFQVFSDLDPLLQFWNV